LALLLAFLIAGPAPVNEYIACEIRGPIHRAICYRCTSFSLSQSHHADAFRHRKPIVAVGSFDISEPVFVRGDRCSLLIRGLRRFPKIGYCEPRTANHSGLSAVLVAYSEFSGDIRQMSGGLR